MINIKLEDVAGMFQKPTTSGDISFIDKYMPKWCFFYSLDSYNDSRGKRIQGIFYVQPSRPDGDKFVVSECPLELLKACRNYRMILNGDFITWTLWFD